MKEDRKQAVKERNTSRGGKKYSPPRLLRYGTMKALTRQSGVGTVADAVLHTVGSQ